MKVAVCIPVYGNPESVFLQSLVSMISHTYEAKLTDEQGEPIPVQIETFVVSSSLLTEGRHRLAAEATLYGADYLLWCDADHVFPPDAFCRLWSRNVDIVGCNYPRRITPTAPTAAKVVGETDAENLVYTTREKAERGELEEVDHLGFGLCLMRGGVFDRLQQHAEEQGKSSFMPLFHMQPHEDFKGCIGEDVWFFRMCREAGMKVWCDHGLSWEVGHVTRQILTNAHANAHKERWGEKQRATAERFREKADDLENAA